ncbi:MAG: hypothetical protein AB7O97_03380 [Planctomycetota bacterium]
MQHPRNPFPTDLDERGARNHACILSALAQQAAEFVALRGRCDRLSTMDDAAYIAMTYGLEDIGGGLRVARAAISSCERVSPRPGQKW